MKGILLVDKPVGRTSHDVVNMIRRAAGMRRVGHTGTLDPNATGLLIICLGQATRLSEFLTGLDKVYEGSMRLGLETDSFDMDGEVVAERPAPEFTLEQIQAVFGHFLGEIEQLPPMVSAVKVGGERLYNLARKGETVERKPRRVTVHEFLALGYEPPQIQFRLRCATGTYARALAHDVGQQLGCGATLEQLRRTWVGHHCVDNAAPAESFESADDVRARLMPMADALNLPAVVVRRGSRGAVVNGGAIGRNDLAGEWPESGGWVQIKAESGELLAVGEAVAPGPMGPLIRPKRVLCGPS